MASEIQVSSAQFGTGEDIPLSAAHPSVGGSNKSPQLTWSGIPAEAKSLAITCWDPDAPTGVGFSHWVRFDIPVDCDGMDEGAGTADGDWTDGFTDWGESEYGGMAPPADDPPHHYRFTVYALDTDSLGLDDHTTYARFQFAAGTHVLAVGTLTGHFGVGNSS
jgi:Raf kinase inhibitor-like YbhB/YbcL family protein